MIVEPATSRSASFASDFVQVLTDEIERYVTALPPGDTTYRGADLRWALQRALYFHFVNDDALRRRWQDEQPAAGWIAALLTANAEPLRAAVLTAPRALNDARLTWRFRRRAARAAAGSRGGLLFSVIHPKFVRYLQAIGLPRHTGRYYCGIDEPLLDALSAAGTPALLAPTLSPARRLTDGRQPLLRRFRLQRLFDAHLGLLARERPRAVVVVEGNAPSDEVMNQACKLVRIPCVCIQQGWSPIVHAAFRNFSFTTMFVWGDEFGRLLAPYSPQQRFVATGSHVIGPVTASSAEDDRTAVSFFLQARSPMIDEAAWAAVLALVESVAARLRDVPMLVREHPSAPLDPSTRSRLVRVPNVAIIAPATTPLQDQLARSRVAVSLFSTTLFESVAGGVVPVAVNPRILRTFVPSLAEWRVGVEATSIGEAEAAIVRLCQDAAFHRSHVAEHERFTRAFFGGLTRDQAKAALQAELARL